MFSDDEVRSTCPARYEPAEWRQRLELAACYRVFFSRGWSEEIFNHITLRLHGETPAYLINPFGLHFGEVTASNLIKCDLAGKPLEETPHVVNRAGFVIHSAIHSARADAHCILHTHDPYGAAIACKRDGLALDNFYGAFLTGRVAYHDFEGVTTHEGEQPRLVASLGDKPCLILRSHGLLVAERTLPAAFYWYYVLQRACQVQVLAHSVPGPTLTLSDSAKQISAGGVQSADPQGDLYPKVFEAAVRRAGISVQSLI